MPELREVFEMVTKQTEPDLDAWREQQDRQRRATRNRRLGALAVAALIGLVATVVVIRSLGNEVQTRPAIPPSPTPQAVPEVDYLIDLDTGEATPLAESIVGSEDQTGSYVLSPDRTRIAYQGEAEDGTRQVFVANLDGSNVRQLSGDPREASWPAWSPDGAMISYVGYGTGDATNVFVVDLVSGSTTRVTAETEPSSNLVYAWSPNGYVIAYLGSGSGNVPGLFLVDLTTGEATRISREDGTLWNTEFAPDGSTIVFTAERDGVFGIYALPITGGNPTLLLGGGGDGGEAGDSDVSPDGSLLSYGYSEFVGGSAQRWVAKADGSDPRPLAETGNFPSASWSPDGTRLAYWSHPGQAVFVVDVASGQTTQLGSGAWPQWIDDQTLIVETDSGL